MEIIGLSGYARSGKDEAANILVSEYGFVRVAFADKLRDVLYALNPLVTVKAFSAWGGKNVVTTPVYVQDVIDVYTWNNYKESEYGSEMRRLLQRLGTEAGRQTLWDSIWIDAAFANMDDDAKVVVTDARFPNEAEAVRERGGSLWRVNRVGVGPAMGKDGHIHASETSLDLYTFDEVLFNDCELETYKENVRKTYERSIANRV